MDGVYESFDFSLLQPWSYGVVAENKPRSDGKGGIQTKILVTPIEKLPFLDGQIKSNPKTIESQGKDAYGQAYHSSATTDLTVVADWLRGENTGRRTPPDVRRGERVQLYRYGDTDKYYWKSLGLDDHLRKGETVIYSLSGTTDEKTDGTHPDNSYYLEASTHDGHIRISTSKSNGEKAKYNFLFDTKNGKVVLNDDAGNQVEIDSVNALIQLVNAMQSAVSINGKNVNIYAPDSMTFKAVNNINIQAGKDIIVQAGKNFNVTCQASSIQAQQNVVLKAVNFNITAETSIDGDLTVSSGKSATFGGSSTFSGPVEFQQTVTAQVINCQSLHSTNPISAPNV